MKPTAPPEIPEVTPDLLLRAYAAGVFPMADSADDPEIYWVEPRQRGLFLFDRFHVPRRLAATLRQQKFRVSADTAFNDVVTACATQPRQSGKTWINATIKNLYGELHQAGRAHSLEVWQADQLVGGIYGVSLGRGFFGESMFSTVRDASKVALVTLAAHLQKQSYAFLDAQFKTPHLAQFGLVEMPRTEYQRLLGLALEGEAFFGAASLGDAAGVAALLAVFLQSSTQIS